MNMTQPTGLTITDYEERAADHRRLARDLDVLLNGEAGAARQASLADIVTQLRSGIITLSGNQLRAALDFINPDGPADELQANDYLYFGVRKHRADDGTVSEGMCCWNEDSDGVLPIPDEYPIPTADQISAAVMHDVLAERRRQIEAKGRTPERDDDYLNDELAAYATYYAMPQAAREWPATETGYGNTFAEAIVPEGWSVPVTQDRRTELVKAAALVLAAIEHLDREATTGEPA